MPRANRYFLPGHVWHITHRWHRLLVQVVQSLCYVQAVSGASNFGNSQMRNTVFDFHATTPFDFFSAMYFLMARRLFCLLRLCEFFRASCFMLILLVRRYKPVGYFASRKLSSEPNLSRCRRSLTQASFSSSTFVEIKPRPSRSDHAVKSSSQPTFNGCS
jgi:hypothetical protein